MRASQESRKRLADDLRYIVDRIGKEKDLRKKVFFLASFGETVGSLLDFEYDPQLVLVQFVFDVASGVIGNRIKAVQTGDDTSVDLVPGFFDKVLVLLSELVVNLEENQDTYKTLEGIVELAHATTDRGYYLYTKGHD